MNRPRSEFPGVILAAGLSSRMGVLGSKLLLPLRGLPLILHVIQAALASRLSEVVVVLGPRPERFREVLPADPRLRAIDNPRFAEGRSTSIRAGLEAIPGESRGVAYLLGDQPLMTSALIDAVVEAAELEEAEGGKGAPVAVAAIRDATASIAKGNPVLFRRVLFERLQALTGDTGARDVIEAHWEEAALVPVRDPWTQFRVETPEDYRRLVDRVESGAAGDHR